jgi:DNA-binding transcriptional LysR family regulator
MLRASIRRFDIFKTVVERRGVNAAADHLGISQPSVTAHLRALERDLGASLFVRRRGVRNVLTPAGETLYRYACEAISKSAELHRSLDIMKAAAPQTIALAVQRSIANQVLPGALASFLRTRKDARISVHSETQEAARELFETGKVDAAILFAKSASADRNIVFLGLQRLAFVAAPDHPLVGRTPIAIAELHEHNFVGGLPESQFFSLIESILKDSGLAQYRVVLHMQDSIAVKNAAMLGLGIACTLLSVAEPEIQQGKLAVIETVPVLPALRVNAMVSAVSESRALMHEFLPYIARGLR